MLIDFGSENNLADQLLSKSEAVDRGYSTKMQDKYFQKSPQLSEGDEEKYQIITEGPMVEDDPDDQQFLDKFLNNNKQVEEEYGQKPLSAIQEDHNEDNNSMVVPKGVSIVSNKLT